MNTLVLVVAIVSCALVQAQKADKDSEIIHQSQDINPDGSYQTAFETDNGIAAQEQGKLKGAGEDAGIEAQGQFTYTSPEGQKIVITYTADENGFQPNGDLPVPPPVPEAILRSLQWNAAHPEEEKEEAAGKRLG